MPLLNRGSCKEGVLLFPEHALGHYKIARPSLMKALPYDEPWLHLVWVTLVYQCHLCLNV
jgi:hypothetical protein